MSKYDLTRRVARASIALLVTGSAVFAGTVAGAGEEVHTPNAEGTVTEVTAEPLDLNSPKPPKGTMKVLEANLCASGADEDCYDRKGSSLKGLVSLIEDEEPQAVVFNEGCWNQLDTVMKAVREANPRLYVHGVFHQVVDAKGKHIACEKGGNYGIGVVNTVAKDKHKGHNYLLRQFTTQVKGGERRAVVCSYLVGAQYVCSTNLAEGEAHVARKQLGQMLEALPAITSKNPLPVIAGGSFNPLQPDEIDAVVSDATTEYVTTGSGDMHVVATDDYTFGEVNTFELKGAKYPAVSVEVTPAR